MTAPLIASPPHIGSYAPADCRFLLTELPAVAIELPTAQREIERRQGRHYAETLPIEYEPTAEYEALFATMLGREGLRIARLALVLAQRIVDERHPLPVLVSLARAGTPVGVILRRALAYLHAFDVPHYSVSIIRDRGLDLRALAYLLERHEPEQIVFVDGWTGKGVIAAELARALAGRPSLSPALAVLADPAHCTALCATRADVLIPSACLNSTVSGLVSRSVLRPDLTGPNAFHATRVYREFADRDRSREYVDSICGHFDAARDGLAASVEQARALPRDPGAGARVVAALQRDLGIRDVNNVKPGIGETTRVLLRRGPSAVAIDPARSGELEHVLLLARERGVPVRAYPNELYACFGLVAEDPASA